jgi:penicillin-binding protein 1A
VTRILQQNVISGTGIAANFGIPAAGKTGTTENHADAWFCGYTPGLETTVWMGYQAGEIPMLDVHGIAVAGGTFPAQIWHLFMQQALANQPVRNFLLPLTYPSYDSSWHGQWQYSGGSYVPTTTTYYNSSTTSYSATTAAATSTPPPAPPQKKQKKKPPPPPPPATVTTTETPPPTTTAPPPPAP